MTKKDYNINGITCLKFGSLQKFFEFDDSVSILMPSEYK